MFGEEKCAAIIICPLMALMTDQVKTLRDHGVEAVIISSGSRECIIVEDKKYLATEGSLKSARIIFSSPEAWYTKSGEWFWKT